MKIKLDENLGEIGADILSAAGHEVSTVLRQSISGIQDDQLYDHCLVSKQMLVTLDRDFGEVIRFPPEDTLGIVVLDCRGRLSPSMIRARMRELALHLTKSDAEGHLWIVEPGRLRIHQRRD